MNQIILPHGNGAPGISNLPEYGLGVDTKNFLLYYRKNNKIVPINAPAQIFISGSEPTGDKDMIWFDDSAQEEIYFMRIKRRGASEWFTPLTDLVSGTSGILRINKGGTGRSSWTQGQIVYSPNGSSLGQIPNGAGALYCDGSNTPKFGTLPIIRGGTGRSSWTQGQIVYSPNGSSLGQIPNGAGALYCDGSNTPKFGTLPIIRGGTGATSKSGAQKNLGIQYGTASITTKLSGSNSTVSVTFSTAFSSVPKVIVSQVFNDKNIVILKDNISATGFTAVLESGFSSVVTRKFDWLAIST